MQTLRLVSNAFVIKQNKTIVDNSEIVRYLPDNKFRLALRCRYCADRAQNLPGPAPDKVLRMLQISSKSVHFQPSYSRTSEHRQNALS